MCSCLNLLWGCEMLWVSEFPGTVIYVPAVCWAQQLTILWWCNHLRHYLMVTRPQICLRHTYTSVRCSSHYRQGLGHAWPVPCSWGQRWSLHPNFVFSSDRLVFDSRESPIAFRLRPPLSSSGQSSWLQIQRSGFDSRRYQILWEVVGLERGSLSLVSTTEELLGRKRSGSGQEIGQANYTDRATAVCLS
jgi:hypothetical protein